MQRLVGYGYVLLAAALWALLGPVAKFGFADGMAPLDVAFWRATIGGLCFALHARRHNLLRIRPVHAPVFILFGVVGIALFFGSYQLAVQGAGAALASILLYTAPAWVALLSYLVFREPFSRAKAIALLLAMAGAGLVCLSGTHSAEGAAHIPATTAGIAFGLLSGFIYALHYIFGKTYLGQYSPVTLYGWSLPVGALVLLPWVNVRPPGLTGCIAMIVLGVFSTYGAYYAYCEGLKRLEATRAAVAANAEPVLAALLAFWWWGEMLSPIAYAGAVLVLAAVLIIVLERSERTGSATS